MCPQCAQRRKWSHQPPLARHSTHPEPLGGAVGSMSILSSIHGDPVIDVSIIGVEHLSRSQSHDLRDAETRLVERAHLVVVGAAATRYPPLAMQTLTPGSILGHAVRR